MNTTRSIAAPPPRRGEICIQGDHAPIYGTLEVPAHAMGLVIFAHGSGSGRNSPRNRRVAQGLRQAGLATLLFDLLTEEEARADAQTAELRFDIAFLASRLELVTRWALADKHLGALRIGYFGASTGAAAALVSAAALDGVVGAVVSRGGRPDLARGALAHVRAPTLLIVGGHDRAVIPLNEQAYGDLAAVKQMEIVPGATHLFEEPGTLEIVTELAAHWFVYYLPARDWPP